MKVAILSMQRIENYGSLLQAYALKKNLENLGAEVEFMDIRKIPEDYDEGIGMYFNFKKEYQGRGFQVNKINRFLLLRIKHKLIGTINNQQIKHFESFRNKYLDLSKRSQHYDLCVIGSDEVFNCMDANSWGFTSQLFGNIPEADRVVTYAASCGATKYTDLPKNIAEKIKLYFARISSFSVRDENTKRFVERLTDKNVSYNLDPVLIYDFKQELENVKLPVLPKKYCVIYSYVNRINNEAEINAILSFCKEKHLVPITVYGTQFWCNRHINCTPFECLKIIANSDFVITDTFHGTIFSTKYANRFAIIIRESNKNKLSDLAFRVGVNDHILKEIGDLRDIYCLEKDSNKINAILEEQRKKTINYLKDSMINDERK